VVDMGSQLQVYEDASGEFRWRKVALRGNLPDEIVSDGAEGYSDRASAADAAQREHPGLDVRHIFEEGSE
jgi:uncharacterized protein YegP (UPF0339 family)